MKRFNVIDRNNTEIPVNNVDDYIWENGSVSFLKEGRKVVSINASDVLSVKDYEWMNKSDDNSLCEAFEAGFKANNEKHYWDVEEAIEAFNEWMERDK